MKVKEYAKLIGRSKQFVRVACQQGQIKAIVLKHDSRHEYEILEGINETNNQSNKVVSMDCGVLRSVHDIR